MVKLIATLHAQENHYQEYMNVETFAEYVAYLLRQRLPSDRVDWTRDTQSQVFQQGTHTARRLFCGHDHPCKPEEYPHTYIHTYT